MRSLLTYILFVSPVFSFCQLLKPIPGKLKAGAYLKEYGLACKTIYETIPSKSIMFPFKVEECGNKIHYVAVFKSKYVYIDTGDIILPDTAFAIINSLSRLASDRFYNDCFYADLDTNSNIHIPRENDDELIKAAKNGIVVPEAYLYNSSEYSAGTGFRVSVTNTGSKTIKYITFNITALNPVGDPVYSTKYSTTKVPVKGVGPIAPFESGTYDFEYVWFSDLPEKLKVNSIIIQYMDGTAKTITDFKKVKVNLPDPSYFD